VNDPHLPRDISDAVRPTGVRIAVTDTDQVVVHFDHGDIPPIVLSGRGAVRAGSQIVSAGHNGDEMK